MRTHVDAFGARSGVKAVGGAVALMVELLSGYPTLPESATRSSYRYGKEVRVRGYPQALRALRELVVEAMIPEKLASTHCVSLQPLRWRLGRKVPQRAIQREGR